MILYDTVTIDKAQIDTTTGFLTAPVFLARVGIQEYYGHELGITDEPNTKFQVYRSPKEVFSEKSLKTFKNLIVTDDHPTELVNLSNVEKYRKGSVSEVNRNGDVLHGVITITEKNMIEKILDGKREVSVGYIYDLEKQSGIYQGVEYQFIQKNIEANHLAIVKKGRCGVECKLIIDKKGSKMGKVKIKGVDYDITDDKLAEAVGALIKTHDAAEEELEKMQKEKDEEEKKKKEDAEEEAKKQEDEEEKKKEEDNEEGEALKKVKDELEKVKAERDSLKKTGGQDAIKQTLKDHTALIREAAQILGDSFPECTDCPAEIKSAVIDKIKGIDVSGKSETYIEAMYDLSVGDYQQNKSAFDALNSDFTGKDFGSAKDPQAARQSARDSYVATLEKGAK
jgi:uncharacterized protein